MKILAKTQQNGKAFLDEDAKIRKALKGIIESKIGPTPLDLEIDVDLTFETVPSSYEVYVYANWNRSHDADVALCWEWRVKLDANGNIRKDSGSWSGLNAITIDQINDLKESVRVLTILNTIDWQEIFEDNTPPNIDDFK